jgi:nitrite reductase/ring-hydroxylating ferredoxin subunit
MRLSDEILFRGASMSEWHQGPLLEALSADRPHEFVIVGKRVGLLRRDDAVYAFAVSCPHAGAPLCDGRLDVKGHLICPLHKYRFNPANGYNSSGEGYKLKTFPVRLEEGRIFVQF